MQTVQDQHLSRCNHLEPVRDSPILLPTADIGPNIYNSRNPWSDQQFNYWPENAHIKRVVVSVSGICGQPKQVTHGDSMVCGMSFEHIRNEITLKLLRTDIPTGRNVQRKIGTTKCLSNRNAGRLLCFGSRLVCAWFYRLRWRSLPGSRRK